MNKQERNVLLFTGRTKFLQQSQSLAVSAVSVVSVGIVSSSAPLALEVEGLQEAVELDSEVELLGSEHAADNCSPRHVSSG